MSPARPPRRDRRGGFVLVEALATLALSAIVLAGAALLVSFLIRAADRTALAFEAVETTGRAVAALERDIRAAARVSLRVEEGRAMVFLGAPDQLMVVLDRTGRNGLVAPVVVRWRSEVGGAGRGRLVRTEVPLIPGQPVPGPEAGRPVVVDTGTEVIRFAYFGTVPRQTGEVLTDGWSQPQQLPTAIRIGRADPGTLQVATSVRVPLRVGAEIACGNPAGGWCSLTPGRREAAEGGESDRRDGAAPEGNSEDPGANQEETGR
jgi:hypothetical protein